MLRQKGSPRFARVEAGLVPILIVLLIAAATFGYLIYSGKINLNQGEMRCTREAKICPDGSSVGRSGPKCEFAPCPSFDETANWKTYTNNKFGYSFQYQFNYYLLDAELMSQTVTGDEFMVNFLKYSSEEAQKYKISNREMAFYDYFGVLVQEGKCSNLTTQSSPVTIDKVQGKKYIGLSPNFADPQYGDILVLINRNNYCYHLAFLRDSNNLKTSEEVFNRILSTFKFTQ